MWFEIPCCQDLIYFFFLRIQNPPWGHDSGTMAAKSDTKNAYMTPFIATHQLATNGETCLRSRTPALAGASVLANGIFATTTRAPTRLTRAHIRPHTRNPQPFPQQNETLQHHMVGQLCLYGHSPLRWITSWTLTLLVTSYRFGCYSYLVIRNIDWTEHKKQASLPKPDPFRIRSFPLFVAVFRLSSLWRSKNP